MDSSRWQRLQDLFHEAAPLPPAQRRACLEARCSDDPGLAAEALGCSRRTRAVRASSTAT
jgi:hypothetical protein